MALDKTDKLKKQACPQLTVCSCYLLAGFHDVPDLVVVLDLGPGWVRVTDPGLVLSHPADPALGGRRLPAELARKQSPVGNGLID